MKYGTALIFGVNDYTFEIEKNIASEYDDIHILQLGHDGENGFDLSDDWDDLGRRFTMEECTAFCILEDIAENIFLTISLRDTFKDLTIISLSQDIESTNKLLLAGATRVLPTLETTSNIIVDMLEKPIVTEVLHDILYGESDLKIAQVQIEDHSVFEGRYFSEIDWSSHYGIIVISLVATDNSSEFIYSSKANHHVIEKGDMLVVVGYAVDIEAFRKLTGKKR